MKLVPIPLCLLVLSPPASAQEASRIDHSIQSAYPEQERTFTVQLPGSYETQPDFAYPVLYVLDGENNLDFSVAVAEFLEQNSLVPELIIVGVHSNATRDRDYLPPNDAAGQPSGQADQFLKYLRTELVPFVEENYRAAPLRLISGHSYGGAFVTYAMVERPDMFRAYLTQSPFLAQGIADPLLAQVSEALSTTPPLNAFFYMNVGDEPALEPGFTRMEEILDASTAESFAWFAKHEAGKTHMTTRMVGQYDGLERFFARDWSLSRAVEVMVSGGSTALESHMDRLSTEYGQEILYGEEAFQQTTQGFLSQQDVPSANASAQVYVLQYPTSPIAHFLLGVTLASGGNRAAGLEAMETAIHLYESDPMPELAPLYENMKQMKQRLGGDS